MFNRKAPASSPWSALATDHQADRLRPILDEIGETLWDRRHAMDPALAAGLPGAALFLAYWGRFTRRAVHHQRALELLAMAVESVQAIPAPSLFGGFPGLAWSIEHLRKHGLCVEGEDPNSEVDEALLDLLQTPHWAGEYDLVNGLVGIGVYGLERLPDAGRPLLHRVLDHLEAMACAHGPGQAWLTAPEHLPRWQRKECPQGYFNHGLAHGIPGVLALLGSLQTCGLEPERCGRLLRAGMASLQGDLDRASGSLPTWRRPDEAPGRQEPVRVAWCYGDLGASLAILSAAESSGCGSWASLAHRLASRAASRSQAESGVVDASLCHGAAGNAHWFNHWYQKTGQEPFRQAGIACLDLALALHAPDTGCAGFTAYTLEEDSNGELHAGSLPHQPCPGLLVGAAGIGLALLSALGGMVPRWDRCFLISPPEPGGVP